MPSQNWFGLSPVLAAGGLLAVIGCLLIRVLVTRPSRRKTVAELVVAVVLSQGTAATLVSGDVGLGAKIALANLAASALVAVWWWGPRKSWRKTSEPTLVFHHGHFMRAGLRRSRLAEEDVFTSLRSQGVMALRATDSVVVSPDGAVSLVRTESAARPRLRLVSSAQDTDTTVHPG